MKRIIGVIAILSSGFVSLRQSIQGDDSVISPDIPPQCSNLRVRWK